MEPIKDIDTLERMKEVLQNTPIEKLSTKKLEEMYGLLTGRSFNDLWNPLPGPQMEAYKTKADELFYGGSAGGGKSDLLLGLALTQHKRSVFLRREGTDLSGAANRLKQLVGDEGTWKGIGPYGGIMRMKDGRTIELKGCKNEDDKQGFHGNTFDLYCFDELCHFSESIYTYVIGWNRDADSKQRCRVVCAGNPPSTQEGRWIIDAWAPWLKKNFKNPAQPGELRWYTRVDDELKWFESGEDIIHRGEKIKLKSRTFIPARLKHNPILEKTGYISVIQAYPEPYRSQLLYGDMNIGSKDHEWQVIPTKWIEAACDRWTKEVPDSPVDCLSVDVARGGKDKTSLFKRRGNYFERPVTRKGTETPDSYAVAALVNREENGTCYIHIDCTGGFGIGAYDILWKVHSKRRVISIIYNETTPERDKTNRYGFINIRALMYWRMREALDPDSGMDIALPPIPELIEELSAPRYSFTQRGIQLEDKEIIKDRIGRSPDLGDGAVMANWMPKKKKLWIA